MVLNEVADWLGQGGSSKADDTVDVLSRKIEELQLSDPDLGWDDLVLSSALARLKEIVDLWQDCLTLRNQIVAGGKGGTWWPAFRHRRVVGRNRHYDYALLAFSAGSVVVGTAIACFFWIFTGWQNGAGFVTMAAVACSFFAALDRPAPFITSMFVWCAISLVIAFVYIFAILPAMNSYEMLVVAFAPPFLLLGLLYSEAAVQHAGHAADGEQRLVHRASGPLHLGLHHLHQRGDRRLGRYRFRACLDADRSTVRRRDRCPAAGAGRLGGSR